MVFDARVRKRREMGERGRKQNWKWPARSAEGKSQANNTRARKQKAFPSTMKIEANVKIMGGFMAIDSICGVHRLAEGSINRRP